MKRLGILIPQYNENEMIIMNLLNSISVQQNVNLDEIEVIVCNDGSDVILKKEFLDLYNFKIKYVQQEHNGVSAARNSCLDSTDAEYIMFCDADDMFENMYSLSRIFFEMRKPFDALNCSFIEEIKMPDGSIKLNKKDNDTTFVHGKVYRRMFLIENNIRWNEKLTIHEDGFFNVLCKEVAKEYRYCYEQLYIWKWRDESVCRHDPKYLLKTYINLIDSNEALISELQNRGMNEGAGQLAYSSMFRFFYTLNKSEWMDPENKEYIDKTIQRFRLYFQKHKTLITGVSSEDKKLIIYAVRNEMSGEGVLIESITLKDFFTMINGGNQ